MNYYPLHEACKGNDADRVRILIEEEGQNTIKKDQYGNTPLHYASACNIQIVQYLLSCNGVSSNINSVNNNGETVFHVTAITGTMDIAELLLDNSANPTIKNKGGYTPLHYAHMYCNQHHFEGVPVLSRLSSREYRSTMLQFYEACQNLWNYGE